MERFLKDNKLVVPEEEIDNVYIWTKISNTQNVLLSSEAFFKLMMHSFEQDVSKVLSVLKQRMPSINLDTYKLSDFITFTANKHLIFNDKNCFVYMNNLKMLNSLACYIAHTMNMYLPEDDSLASLIINKIDEPEKFTKMMDTEFLILRIYANLPEHKYRSAILDSLLSRRSKQGLYTLIYTLNTNMLIGNNLIVKERAEDKRLIDLSPLGSIFDKRRKSDYRSLLKIWYELMGYNKNNFIYSKEKPKTFLNREKQ